MLSNLTEVRAVSSSLEEGGLSPEAARRHAELAARCAHWLLRTGAAPDANARTYFVPGRIEVLGKHTDYCGGRSLLAATERGFVLVTVEGSSGLLEVIDVLREEGWSFPISPELEVPRGPWWNYPMTVARRVARNFPGARVGGRVAFGSTLPEASGLSSSSAFMIGLFLALSGLNGLETDPVFRKHCPDPAALATYLASVENGSSFGDLEGDSGVGTQGGSEDHTAILDSNLGQLALYSFGPARLESRIDLPEGWVFVVGSSGVVARKTGAAMERYNRAARLGRLLVEIWNRLRHTREPHLASLVRSAPDAVEALTALLDVAAVTDASASDLRKRLEHFVAESESIIPQAVRCLESGDIPGFGASVERSQEAGARLLGNQVPETLFLAEEARRLGAAAASAFGAGFGGSVWALVEREEVRAFVQSWQAAYEGRFPARAASARFFVTSPSTAAFRIAPSSESR